MKKLAFLAAVAVIVISGFARAENTKGFEGPTKSYAQQTFEEMKAGVLKHTPGIIVAVNNKAVAALKQGEITCTHIKPLKNQAERYFCTSSVDHTPSI